MAYKRKQHTRRFAKTNHMYHRFLIIARNILGADLPSPIWPVPFNLQLDPPTAPHLQRKPLSRRPPLPPSPTHQPSAASPSKSPSPGDLTPRTSFRLHRFPHGGTRLSYDHFPRRGARSCSGWVYRGTGFRDGDDDGAGKSGRGYGGT